MFRPDPHPRRRPVRTLVAAILFGLCSAVAAEPTSSATAPATPTTSTTTPAPQCVHGCQRWGKACNVDPRGVYKCRRICEKFGEICE